MSSMAHAAGESVSSQADRPERSRNAKAQARHRAKRKAYIEQLEQTVTKLQTALGFTPDQVAALPPPLVKIRELEQENTRLQKENEEMRRLLGDADHRGGHVSSDYRRSSLASFHESRNCDRDFKKRKLTEDLYMPEQTHDTLARPPPLTIPQPLSHHHQYNNNSSHSVSNNTSLYNLHAPAFHQLPNTPSGSSSTSSPPFSPAQMHNTSHSPINSRPNSLSHHHPLSGGYHSTSHYGSVKVEDDHYNSSHHHTHNGQSGHYHTTTLPSFSQTVPENDLDSSWHTYSAERAHVHR